MVDPALEAAYRDTDYRVENAPFGPFAIRISEPSTELAGLLAASGTEDWAYVTACNPGSVRLSGAENAQRMADLEAMVRSRGWRFFHGYGVGRSGDWPAEASLLILGIPLTDAVALARHFGQNAIVTGGPEGIPRLEWVD